MVNNIFWRLLAETTPPPGIVVIDANEAVANVFKAVLMLIGAISVIYIIVGGISYTLSAGDSNKITKAKDTILYAVVGLVIVVSAFLIINMVIEKF